MAAPAAALVYPGSPQPAYLRWRCSTRSRRRRHQPQLRDFKPQGLAITAWAFDTINRALGGGDGTVIVRVVPTLDASDM